MIKVGDYIRCGSAGIREVTEIMKSPADFSVKSIIDEKGLFIQIKYIQKYANNLLDLIEVGDYVNGYKILGIRKKNNKIEMLSSTDHACNCWFVFNEEDIVSVVTREAFESREYKPKRLQEGNENE